MEKGVKIMVKIYFIVDCIFVGLGDIGIVFIDGNGRDVFVKIID